jgi:hypothetical protein
MQFEVFSNQQLFEQICYTWFGFGFEVLKFSVTSSFFDQLATLDLVFSKQFDLVFSNQQLFEQIWYTWFGFGTLDLDLVFSNQQLFDLDSVTSSCLISWLHLIWFSVIWLLFTVYYNIPIWNYTRDVVINIKSADLNSIRLFIVYCLLFTVYCLLQHTKGFIVEITQEMLKLHKRCCNNLVIVYRLLFTVYCLLQHTKGFIFV